MKLIGIKGRLHSGKDTTVEYIRQAAGPQATVDRAGFADKMKRSGLEALGYDTTNWPIERVLEVANEIKECGDIIVVLNDRESSRINGRLFWQRYGTEAHRDIFWQEFWVDALFPVGLIGNPIGLAKAFPGTDILVVTDCRFPNEAERILDLGGDVWQIEAEGRLGPLPEDAHVSEYPLPPEYVTLTVPNNGTLDQFEVAVRSTYSLTIGGLQRANA